MSNTQKILPETCNDVLCDSYKSYGKLLPVIYGPKDIENWHQFPLVDIQYDKLYPGIKELPVEAAAVPSSKPLGNLSSEYLLFKLDPDNKDYVLVFHKCDAELLTHIMHPLPKDVLEDMFTLYKPKRVVSVRLGTPMEVATTLLAINKVSTQRIRVHLDYGNVNMLKSWNDTYAVDGYVGLTTGDKKSLILCHNQRSNGGGAILTDCILSIRGTKKTHGGYVNFYTLDNMFTNGLCKIE